jgi:hypothetical protein
MRGGGDPAAPPGEQDRPDIAEQRDAWRAEQAALSRGRLVFIPVDFGDETGASTRLARRYGRCRRGERLDMALPPSAACWPRSLRESIVRRRSIRSPQETAPAGAGGEMIGLLANHGHWKSTTFVAGLTNRGFIAPYVLDGAMDGPRFKAWTEQMLAPKLEPGDIVVMDNLAAHKVQGVRQAIGARGAELRYLPPYSPDLNPSNVSRRSIRTLKGTRSGDRGGRERLRQAQGTAQNGCRAHDRRLVDHHRQAAPLLLISRMPELHRECGLYTVSMKML